MVWYNTTTRPKSDLIIEWTSVEKRAVKDFALLVIESGQLDAEACKVVASFALEFTGDDNV